MNHDLKHHAPHPRSDVHGPPRRLDPVARIRIGRGLRLLYAEVLTAPLPARLQVLVADLAARMEAS